jgi:hypothetical protein
MHSYPLRNPIHNMIPAYASTRGITEEFLLAVLIPLVLVTATHQPASQPASSQHNF